MCFQAGQPASKQWGFAVSDGLSPTKHVPRTTPEEASSAHIKGEEPSWALGTQWRDTPFSLQEEPSTSSSGFTGTSNFKGFKDSCEAGSFTLSPSQVG